MLIKGSFKQQNILWEVYFKSDLYPEVSLEIGSSPDGIFGENQNFQVYFSSDAVEVTTESPEDTFQPIIKHSATVNLLTKTYIGQYFWSESPLDIRVEIFRNKEIIFSGFVTQGSYSQSYADCYDELNISCVDYLSVLEYYNYADISHNYDSYKTSATNVSFQKIFNNLLIDGLDFHLGQKSSLYYDQSKDSVFLKNTIFDDIEFSELNFLGDDEDSVDTKEDVLSKILTYLNLHIVQLGKDYLIFDWDFINNVSEGNANYIDLWDRSKTFTKSLLTSPDYPELIKKFHYSSSSTNLSIADVYNKIQVNCSLDSTDDAIVSPFDDEITTQVYPKKYLYQTEVLSPGKGFGDAKEFLDYVKYNDKSVDDDFTVIDYYIQQISNPAWTLYGGHDVQKDFTVVHQDILKYVPYNSKGEPYKAYFIPSEFPERFGVTALYSIGCIQKKQEDINKDMSKISPNSLQMSPYIVISVNGNGDDSENGHKPTDQDIIDAVPIAEYTGNISGGVYSPSDDDTTNYMVFSGKIMYVPRTWSELTFVWDNIKQFDNFMSLLGFTVPYFKDEGKTFRTNKFYTVDNPTSIQDDSVFDGSSRDFTDQRRSPYLDLSFANSQDKVKWFKYNYTRLENGDASSIDNINKLSVFECQLIIGDKTFVETVNSDGSSTYSWETYNPAYDKTVNQQSFTLGIDPNKGDYILGQDFEIENNITFDMNLGSNKGFAIPIKKSDNLKGNIVFKILGPFQLQWNDITKRHKTMFRHTKYTDHYKYILANCSSIVIKDFNCKLISDNSGLEVNNEKDLIYVSTEDKKFTNSYETDFDITSGLSSQECYEKQINNKIYMNYPVTTKGEVVTKIVNKNYQVSENQEGDPVFLQDKPEKFYIDQYFREYSKPRIIFQVPVREKLFTNKPMIDLFGSFVCFQTFRDRSFKLIGIDYSSDDETPRNLTFKELPEEFGKPADDYDWTDNSETGGEVEIDKGGPNESIEVDPEKINDYFTITNTESLLPNIRVTVHMKSTKKIAHYYYTIDDKKWIRCKDNEKDYGLSRGQHLRLRCIFNGNSETGSYLTFDCDGSANISGNLQTLSKGDLPVLGKNQEVSEVMLLNDSPDDTLYSTYSESFFEGKGTLTFNGFDIADEDLIVSENNYKNMFANTRIQKVNFKLNSKWTRKNCYEGMFKDCSMLDSIPENFIDAKDLAEGSCKQMFKGCNRISKLPKKMFTNNLQSVDQYSCQEMFANSGISVFPQEFFDDSVQLSENCYIGMLSYSNIVEADIQMTNVPNNAFSQMFEGCSNLRSINYRPTTLGPQVNGDNPTQNWVKSVAYSGEWYNANKQEFIETGNDKIPLNWVIFNQPRFELEKFFTITNTGSQMIYFDTENTGQYQKNCINLVTKFEYLKFYDQYTMVSVKNNYDNIYLNINDNGWQNLNDYEDSIVYLKPGEFVRLQIFKKVNDDPVCWFRESGMKQTWEISGNMQTLQTGVYIYDNNFKDGIRYQQMFLGCSHMTIAPDLTLGLHNIKAGIFVNNNFYLHYMFGGCSSITEIPADFWPTGQIGNVSTEEMFANCTNLVKVNGIVIGEEYSFEPEMYGKQTKMFINCGKLKLDHRLFYRGKCYASCFSGCTSITEIPADFFNHVTTIGYDSFDNCFEGCTSLTKIPDKIFYNIKLLNQGASFASCFAGCTSLTKIPNDVFNYGVELGDLASPNCNNMFKNCTSLTEINNSLFRINNIYYREVFAGCTGLKNIPEDLFPMHGVRDFVGLFSGCTGLTSIPNKLFYNKNNMDCTGMFRNCTGLTSLPENMFNGCRNIYASHMFKGCTGLTSLPDNLFNDCSVFDCSSMFSNFIDLTSLPDNLFNDCSVFDCTNMFYNCSGLTSLPDNLFNTCASFDCTGMFRNCTGLTSLQSGLLKRLDYTWNLKNMFEGCSGLTIVNDGFFPQTVTYQTDKVDSTISLANMFSNCTKLKSACINITNIADGKKHVSMNYMFYECSKLEVLKFYGNKIYKTDDSLYDPDITDNWLYGVSQNGTFYRKRDLYIDYERSASTIPKGWGLNIVRN